MSAGLVFVLLSLPANRLHKTMKLINIYHKLRRKNPYRRKKLKELFKLVNDPLLSAAYFPESERKPKTVMWWDNLLWLTKFGEVNKYYYVYGLDRKQGSDSKDFISYINFYRKRDSRNLRPNKENYSYVCLLRDKFIFGQFMSSLGFSTPKNLALLDSDEVIWLSDMKSMPLNSLIENKQININGFCKRLTGILGEGAFPLKISGGKVYIKDEEITFNQLKETLNGKYLWQNLLTQHPLMSELHPPSVNTMRIVSFNNNGKVEIFSAALRIGTKGRSVDNGGAGGILVGIDLQTGKLKKEGFYKPGYGTKTEKHPDTGIIFENFQIPFFAESVDLVGKLHNYFYGIHSVGWDVAITLEGPMFIEGNDDWNIPFPTGTEKDFKSRFLKMYE